MTSTPTHRAQHRSLGAIRLMAPTWAPTPVSRFFLVLVGTCRPSCRRSRRTRLLFTDQPSRCSSLAARRHPHRGRRFAKPTASPPAASTRRGAEAQRLVSWIAQSRSSRRSLSSALHARQLRLEPLIATQASGVRTPQHGIPIPPQLRRATLVTAHAVTVPVRPATTHRSS